VWRRRLRRTSGVRGRLCPLPLNVAEAVGESLQRSIKHFLCRDSDGRLWYKGRLPFGIPLSPRSLLPGLTGARRQLALLLRFHRPEGHGFRPKSCSQSAAKRFLRSLRKCSASALGAGPLAGSAQV
jgi:hypothetical protein